MDDRTEQTHHLAADGLLTQGGSDPEDRAAQTHYLTRVGQSSPPLPRARARNQVLHTCAGVVSKACARAVLSLWLPVRLAPSYL